MEVVEEIEGVKCVCVCVAYEILKVQNLVCFGSRGEMQPPCFAPCQRRIFVVLQRKQLNGPTVLATIRP